jgi:hypothetical protein
MPFRPSRGDRLASLTNLLRFAIDAGCRNRKGSSHRGRAAPEGARARGKDNLLALADPPELQATPPGRLPYLVAPVGFGSGASDLAVCGVSAGFVESSNFAMKEGNNRSLAPARIVTAISA